MNSTQSIRPGGAIVPASGAHRPESYSPERYRVELRLTPAVPRLVRRTVRAYLILWRLRELAEAAELAASELVGNVAKHVPDRRCVLTVERRAAGVRVEVWDGSPVLPARPRAAGFEEESGRGLALVALVTHAWGVRPEGEEGKGGGKTVWFELDAEGS
ncbi:MULTISPECIES: ATP-binding protein [unclassified Streptomyces]|uniref:ATP-binding protein n=1 Tax=unclassified Streptomyces TaxID=2593676 RepID=UPI00211D2BE9|nr:ATP-binding protein [Streptomyces sp. Ru87]